MDRKLVGVWNLSEALKEGTDSEAFKELCEKIVAEIKTSGERDKNNLIATA